MKQSSLCCENAKLFSLHHNIKFCPRDCSTAHRQLFYTTCCISNDIRCFMWWYVSKTFTSFSSKKKFWLNKNCLSLSTNRHVRKHEVYKIYLRKKYFLTPIGGKSEQSRFNVLMWFFKLYFYWSGANLKLLFNIEIDRILEQCKNIPYTQKEHWKFQISSSY